MGLSELQQKIIDYSDDKTVVIASAAAGKTTVLTEKVRQIIRQGYEPNDIAVITFTNMAASELKSRLGDDYKSGMFIGTIHSLANYMLTSSGIKTNKIISNEEFDKLFDLIKKNRNCVKNIEYLILDEAQDSSNKQFEFMFDIIRPTHYFVVGDPKQSIYGFNGGNPFLMIKLGKNEGVKVFNLNENYRNGYNILQFAKQIISPTGMTDFSIPMTKDIGNVYEIPFSSDRIIDGITSSDDQYKDWAILTRTNKDIELIKSKLDKSEIPNVTFKQGDLSKEDLVKKMQENTVKILTIHSAKGLEWNNVIVIGTRFAPIEERNVCYVAATRAKKNLYWMKSAKKAVAKKNVIHNW